MREDTDLLEILVVEVCVAGQAGGKERAGGGGFNKACRPEMRWVWDETPSGSVC